MTETFPLNRYVCVCIGVTACMHMHFTQIGVQSILGCLSHRRITEISTDQSNASYAETPPSTMNLIGQFGFSFFCDGSCNLNLTLLYCVLVC